jgi:ribosomal protein S1
MATGGSQVHIKPGTICEASLGGVSSDGIDVIIHPEEIPAFIPAYHLSDHCDHWQPLLAVFSARLKSAKSEEQIVRAIAVERDKSGRLILSMKPVLMTSQAIKHAQSLEFSDLKIGLVMAGVVKQIMPFGCFISFFGGLLGLAPIRKLTDKYLNSPTDVFRVGQSVFAKVTEIDRTKQRFLVSLCRSDVENTKRDDSLSDILHFNSYLSERHIIEQTHCSQSQDSAKLFANVPYGNIVEGKVRLSQDMCKTHLVIVWKTAVDVKENVCY